MESDTVTIEEAITNELQLVNFLLQGGNQLRATERALRASTLYAAAGRQEEALVVARWALELDPCAYTAEQFSLCLLTLGPRVIEVFRQAALVLLDRGEEERARDLLGRIVAADPEHPSSRLIFADLWLRTGRNDEAIAQMWAAVDLFERHGRAEGRLEILRRIVGIDPFDVTAWRELGRSELLAMDYDAALAAFTRLLQLRPDDQGARELLAETLARSERPHSALAILRSVLTHYEASAKFEAMRRLVRRAVTWNPCDERYCLALDRLAALMRKALPPVVDAPSAPLRVVS